MSGKVVKVAGPLVVAEGLADANVSDVVRVGPRQLIGEILNMTGDRADIQVYEETGGLGPGAEVVTTGAPLSVELGPGMLEGIYDGIQRPLTEIRDLIGHSIATGISVPALNRKKQWDFTPCVERGAKVVGGDIIGTVPETPTVLHKIMVPPKLRGTVARIQSGSFTVTDTVAVLKTEDGEEKAVAVFFLDGADDEDLLVFRDQVEIFHDFCAVNRGNQTAFLVRAAASADFGFIFVTFIGIEIPVFNVADADGVNMAVDCDDFIAAAHPAENVALRIDFNFVKAELFHFSCSSFNNAFFLATFRRDRDQIPKKSCHSRTISLGRFFDCIKIHVE